ncbi:DUF1080 domain-containing protein [uncultured Eudoraea sp.]|uniref:3-keto-disaccharide hydrolase n=1 Tax=uncultured Eudoraea sp. TaxID=1035614 RepID=UPI0026051B9C|nr:DUF1080 domain-containing protein [uncultured Eudoraea sp.]
MKHLFFTLLLIPIVFSCKDNSAKNITDKNADMTSEINKKGLYDVVFFDVNDTIFEPEVTDKVIMESSLIPNVNLINENQFWSEKRNFFMHGLGVLNISDSNTYYFRLTSNGKVKLQLNNIDLIVHSKSHSNAFKEGERYLPEGPAVFDYEYFPGNQDPHLVLEWSKDGKTFEVIPDSVYSGIEVSKVKPMEGFDEESNANELRNSLSEEEKKDGWKLLFDGKTTNGWHTYGKPGSIGSKWQVENGLLVFQGRRRYEYFINDRKFERGPTDKYGDGGGEIITDEVFENFEFTLEWKLTEGGNSGIFYTVQNENEEEAYYTSPEMQILDNQGHKDGLIDKHRAGDLYDLIPSNRIMAKIQGTWNKVRIIKKNGKVEHWFNGTQVLSYDLNSNEYAELVARSKFASYENFINSGPGRISLQDHDNRAYFKNIKIKPL